MQATASCHEETMTVPRALTDVKVVGEAGRAQMRVEGLFMTV